MIILSTLVIGWISLYRIPLLYIPEITGHSLRVHVPYKSSSPQEVEDVIKPKIQRINGVANVDVRGIEQKKLFVELDLERLKSHNIDTFVLRRYLRTNNINVSAGDIIEGSTKYVVRTIGEFQNVSEVAALPVNEKGIRLSDVADVRYDFSVKDRYQRLNGRNAVKVKVMKSSDANMVAVAREVVSTIKGIKADPEMKRLEIYVYRDRSQAILERIGNLRNAGLLGGVLVIFILFFFLRNVRSALIITAAIPISVLCTFGLMFLLRKFVGSEVTLNIISLTGLLLAIGMLVDPAVVVLENIFRHKQEKKNELEIETVSSNFDRSGGSLAIYYIRQEGAKRPVSALEKEMRSLFPVIPGVKYRKLFRRGHDGREIHIEIKGRNIDTLTRLADDIKDRLVTIPDLSDVQTNLEEGKDEIVVSIDRDKAGRYGLTSERIAFGIAGSLGGRAVSKFKIEDKEIDITLQLKEEDRQRLDQLKNLESENVEKEDVVLGRVVDFERRRGPEAIERKDRKPIVIITAQYNNKGLTKIREQIMAKMEYFNLPAGYAWSLGEEFRRFEREEAETRFGLILAIILIYLIMASLFESYIHPLTILLTIPFAFTGVAVVFYLLDIPLDSVSRLGLLLLCGLVVNNAIVLIDYVNRLRRGGMDRHSAIVKGGRDRLRPILMTSFTTILGLLPMVIPLFLPLLYGPLEGRERIWAPVGLVVISGLITSTILTLVIMPTIYSLVDDVGRWMKEVFATT